MADEEITSAARLVRVQTATHLVAPVDGTTVPDVVTSPVNVAGAPTSGLQLMIKAPTFGTAATFTGAGFTVTVYVRNPVTKQWGSTAAFTMAFGEWWATGDFEGGELFFLLGAVNVAGGIDFHVLEQ